MSDTHINAYRIELAEKKAKLSTLQGEVDSLQAFVDAADKTEADVADEATKKEAFKEKVAADKPKRIPVETPAPPIEPVAPAPGDVVTPEVPATPEV